MIKKVILLLTLISLPAFAGDFENAAKNNNYVMLYLYSPYCSYCTKFNPVYNNLAKNYGKSYSFVKANADDNYGFSLMRKFRAHYVPYVILYDSKKQEAAHISPACYTDEICMQRALNKFKTN